MPAANRKPLAEPARRPRQNRRRRELARQPVLHVVMPGIEVAREHAKAGETISAFLSRTQWARKDRTYGWQFRKGLPTILEVDGEPVLRKDWGRRRIKAGDQLRFTSYPLGGGNGGAKQIIGLVALVAVSAFAFWLPGAIGLTGLLAQGLTAAIGASGCLLVSVFGELPCRQ